MSEKIIAVDFDDVCVDSFRPFVEWHNRKYGFRHTVEDYIPVGHYYGKLWGTEGSATWRRFIEFHKEYASQIRELPGCLETLRRLKERNRLDMCTYRSWDLTEVTRDTLDRLFPAIFDRFDMCGWNSQTGVESVNKARLCRERGAGLIIEDTLSTALECAEIGIPVLLMDAPWNRDAGELPALVRRVSGWWEIGEIVLPKEEGAVLNRAEIERRLGRVLRTK